MLDFDWCWLIIIVFSCWLVLFVFVFFFVYVLTLFKMLSCVVLFWTIGRTNVMFISKIGNIFYYDEYSNTFSAIWTHSTFESAAWTHGVCSYQYGGACIVCSFIFMVTHVFRMIEHDITHGKIRFWRCNNFTCVCIIGNQNTIIFC